MIWERDVWLGGPVYYISIKVQIFLAYTTVLRKIILFFNSCIIKIKMSFHAYPQVLSSLPPPPLFFFTLPSHLSPCSPIQPFLTDISLYFRLIPLHVHRRRKDLVMAQGVRAVSLRLAFASESLPCPRRVPL